MPAVFSGSPAKSLRASRPTSSWRGYWTASSAFWFASWMRQVCESITSAAWGKESSKASSSLLREIRVSPGILREKLKPSSIPNGDVIGRAQAGRQDALHRAIFSNRAPGDRVTLLHQTIGDLGITQWSSAPGK